MVSILPGERTPWDVIGKQLGEGLSRTLPEAVQRGVERGQIQQGLKQLQDMTPEQISQMQPHQLIASILSPFAGTRQGAQYAESILPSLQKLLTRNQLYQRGSQGTGIDPSMHRGYENEPTVNIPGMQQQPPSEETKRFLDFASNAAKAGSQAFQYQQPGQGKPQVQPELTEAPTLPPGSMDVQNMLEYASNTADPFAYIDYYSKVNKLAQGQREELYNEYVRNFEKESNRLDRENQFRDFSKGATADKNYSSDDFNRLIRYSDKYISEPSQTRRLHHAQRDLDRYNGSINALENARKAPGFFENLGRGQEMANKQIENAVKPLVELGEIDKAKELVSGLGLGPLQTERVVNPLPIQSKKALSTVKPAPPSYSAAPTSSVNVNAQKRDLRQNELAKLPDIIADAVSKGGEFSSLKLIRDSLFKKGYLEHEFASALTTAIDNGLKLSDYQKLEQSELGRRQRRPIIDIFFSDEPGELLRSPSEMKKEAGRTFRGYE